MKKNKMDSMDPAAEAKPAALIDAHLAALDDWRGAVLSRVRKVILQADSKVVETVKWRKPSNPNGVPVWECGGILCTGETYKDKVKLTFAQGAALADPAGLFNAGLAGNLRRAIDIHKGDKIDAKALKALVRAAVALNAKKKKAAGMAADKRTQVTPVLLSGGNPQIAKADGDAPVQAYIAAMPGWKRDAGRRLDALIVNTVPGVSKAVRWNSPFYGIEGQGWFLSYHCFAKYIKVAFFRGAALDPLPPVASKSGETRYLHLYENEAWDEAQLVAWIAQASKLPGEMLF